MPNDIPPHVCETLKQLVNGDEENLEMVLHNPNKKGEGFGGEIIYVTIKNKETQKELNVMVKQAFKDQAPIRNIYLNEIYFYAKIWPALDKFQVQIPIKYRFQKIPKCLATVSDTSFEYLVMENLKFHNFQNHDKKLPLGKDYYEIIFREFGKFHGISFAYKALHPKDFADLAKGIVDMYSDIVKNETSHNATKYSYESCVESLQPGVDDAVIEKLQQYLQNYKGVLEETVGRKTEYTVINHGDCWSSNMMFKYDATKKVTDVRFLDFQFVRVASPCCDLSYCIYSGASKEVLKDLDYFLQIYHDSLSETLKQFGCDSQELYPLQELKKEWKIFSKLGFTQALMVWKIKFTHEADVKTVVDLKLEDHAKIFQGGYDKDAYGKVVKDLLYHLYENDFL